MKKNMNMNMKIRIIVLAVLVAILLLATSCVKDEMNVGPAIVENVTMAPAAPQSTEVAVISAKITDLKGISSAKLYYKAEVASTFINVALVAGQGNLYTATIPAFAKDTKVQYYIEVVNNDNITSFYPAKAPTAFASYTVGASSVIKLFVNEVFPDGTKDDTDPDWVELYNDSDIEVNLSGYAFYDDGIKISNGVKPKRILEDGLKIPAKGFLVLRAEKNIPAATVEFGLSTSGDAVYIENKEGVVVAELDFNGISTAGKKSYGRQPDGSKTVVLFNNATKGTSNNNAN